MRFSQVGVIDFRCSSCDTQINGPYEDVMQLLRFHNLQHHRDLDVIDAFLLEMEDD